MNQNCNGIYVARNHESAFVRVNGRGNYQNAAPLRRFGQEAIDQGCHDIYLDLAECQGMDSTFLGVLAGFGLRLRQPDCRHHLHLFNAGNRTMPCCQSLGLDRLADLESGLPAGSDLHPPSDGDFQPLPGTDISASRGCGPKAETSVVMLEAHEDLCRADERNESKFKDVKHFLREEVARQKTSGS